MRWGQGDNVQQDVNLDFETPIDVNLNVTISLSPSLEKLIQTYLNKSISQGETMAADLSALSDAVTAQTTVVESAVTLIAGLADELRNAANDPAAVQALADQLTANTDQLAAAVNEVPHPEQQ